MNQRQRSFIAIDLKSFYASVECVERKLDPLDTNLVVADETRTDKTICLAVSPSLKSIGLPGRARLFEAKERLREENYQRRKNNHWLPFTGKSYSFKELSVNKRLEADFIVAPPRMAHYIDYSTRIYKIYLRYAAPEDIHVYSIDEVFIDASNYLYSYKMTTHDLAMRIIRDVLKETGITATAGIGTNLYLSKIAMDIVAKKKPADKDGVRIAELDELSYRQQLWDHKPLTDFWRIGRGTMKRLAQYGIQTMGDIARLSLSHEDFFFQLFGINAELLIDHAWGQETAEMKDIKEYRPETNSLSHGQVLSSGYDATKAEVIVQEMAQSLALELVEKKVVTNQLVLSLGYDAENLSNEEIHSKYSGEITKDYYGRDVPKSAHGSENLSHFTFSSNEISTAALNLFRKIGNPTLLIRRIHLTANHVVPENRIPKQTTPKQLNLFVDYEALAKKEKKDKEIREKERRLMETTISLKKRFGKNSILKGLNWQEGSTIRDRNSQIGGHKA